MAAVAEERDNGARCGRATHHDTAPHCAAAPHCQAAHSINAVAYFTITTGTVTPAIKLQQWKCRMRLKDDDATTPDHCDECNNGILETKVATIGSSKPELSAPASLRDSTIRTIRTLPNSNKTAHADNNENTITGTIPFIGGDI